MKCHKCKRVLPTELMVQTFEVCIYCHKTKLRQNKFIETVVYDNLLETNSMCKNRYMYLFYKYDFGCIKI